MTTTQTDQDQQPAAHGQPAAGAPAAAGAPTPPVPPPATPPLDTLKLPPVSERTVLDCLNSSKYWIAVLPEYANDMQRRADRWAIVAGALSAVGGLGVWLTIMKDARTWVQFAVSAVAFAAAIAALVPRVKNYGEMAGQARQLMTPYGHIEGLLRDAVEQRGDGWPPHQDLRGVIEAFDATKASKDTNLRHLPRKPVDAVGLEKQHGVLTWPPDTYEQARDQMRRSPYRWGPARWVSGVFR